MRKTLLLAASLTLSVSAHAEPMKWSGVSLSIDSVTFDEELPDATGTVISGAFAIEPAYLFGSLGGYDFDGAPIEVRTANIGVGGYADIADGTALFGEFGRWSQETEYTPTGYSVSDSGTGLGLGLRHQFAPRLEGRVGLSRSYVDGDASDSIQAGVRAFLTHNVFLGASVSDGEDSTTTRLTVGAAF